MKDKELEEMAKDLVKELIIKAQGEAVYYNLIGQRIQIIREWKVKFKDLLDFDERLFKDAIMAQMLANLNVKSMDAIAVEAALFQTAIDTEEAL